MNIIQITDIHLCGGGGLSFAHADSTHALRSTVDYLLKSRISIDMIVVSGDISTDGSMDSYQAANTELKRLPYPVFYVPGNHDNRDNMARAGLLPQDTNEAACRLIKTPEASVLLLDTTQEGRSMGGVEADRLTRLRGYLAKDLEGPVFLFMHHVPFTTGYAAMDEPFRGLEELVDIISNKKLYVCCGHIHASMATRLGQANVITCPPVCMEMEFDLSPEGGDMFYISEPQFVLHTVNGSQVITHFVSVPTCEMRKGPYTFSI